MNNSILRGFCQTCDRNARFDLETGGHHVSKEEDLISCISEFTWFLSRFQIERIGYSNEYKQYCKEQHGDYQYYGNLIGFLNFYLASKPFLVARILAESEKEVR